MKCWSSDTRSRKSERIDTTTRVGAVTSSATPARQVVKARRSRASGVRV